MKIGVAQTKPVKGDLERNIENHKKLIHLAVKHGADMLVFPELSLTGYEPGLAKNLATAISDKRFDEFQAISDTSRITIGVGIPTANTDGINISMLLFQPQAAREIYHKEYLHSDELPFFVTGKNTIGLIGNKSNTALAICYELSVREHAEHAFKKGAEIYVASVAKTAGGMKKAIDRLAEIASNYSMIVLVSNCIGHCDDFDCGGKTSAWNNKGILIGQLNDIDEGVIVLDKETGEIIVETI